MLFVSQFKSKKIGRQKIKIFFYIIASHGVKYMIFLPKNKKQ